ERGVVHETGRAGVGEETPQLVGAVAVVDVERRDARFEGAEHRLEELVAVVAADAEMALTRFPRLELVPLTMGAEAQIVQMVRQAPRPLGGLSPREAAAAEDERFTFGHGGSQRVVHVPHVHVHRGDANGRLAAPPNQTARAKSRLPTTLAAKRSVSRPASRSTMAAGTSSPTGAGARATSPFPDVHRAMSRRSRPERSASRRSEGSCSRFTAQTAASAGSTSDSRASPSALASTAPRE